VIIYAISVKKNFIIITIDASKKHNNVILVAKFVSLTLYYVFNAMNYFIFSMGFVHPYVQLDTMETVRLNVRNVSKIVHSVQDLAKLIANWKISKYKEEIQY